jgi:hypothetical protein
MAGEKETAGGTIRCRPFLFDHIAKRCYECRQVSYGNGKDIHMLADRQQRELRKHYAFAFLTEIALAATILCSPRYGSLSPSSRLSDLAPFVFLAQAALAIYANEAKVSGLIFVATCGLLFATPISLSWSFLLGVIVTAAVAVLLAQGLKDVPKISDWGTEEDVGDMPHSRFLLRLAAVSPLAVAAALWAPHAPLAVLMALAIKSGCVALIDRSWSRSPEAATF